MNPTDSPTATQSLPSTSSVPEVDSPDKLALVIGLALSIPLMILIVACMYSARWKMKTKQQLQQQGEKNIEVKNEAISVLTV